jgi:hypothetical protein
VCDCPGISEQRASGIREHRVACATFEQLHPDLGFEVRQRLADNRLGAPEPPSSCGEAAFVCGRKECSQLIERYAVQHLFAPTNLSVNQMHYIE